MTSCWVLNLLGMKTCGLSAGHPASSPGKAPGTPACVPFGTRAAFELPPAPVGQSPSARCRTLRTGASAPPGLSRSQQGWPETATATCFPRRRRWWRLGLGVAVTSNSLALAHSSSPNTREDPMTVMRHGLHPQQPPASLLAGTRSRQMGSFTACWGLRLYCRGCGWTPLWDMLTAAVHSDSFRAC